MCWLFETKHTNQKAGIINYVVWSEVLLCSSCNCEIVYVDAAVKRGKGIVSEEFKCKKCSAVLTKASCEKAIVTYFDFVTRQTVSTVKFVPVLINYFWR